MKKGERRRVNAKKNKQKPRRTTHKRPKGRKNPAFDSDAIFKQAAPYLMDLAALSFFQSLFGVGAIGSVIMGAMSKPANEEDIEVTPFAGGKPS